MKSAWFIVAIFSFFSRMVYNFIIQKSASTETDLKLFWTFAVIVAKFAISTRSEFFRGKPTQNMLEITLGGFIEWETLSTFVHLCTFQNIIGHLNQAILHCSHSNPSISITQQFYCLAIASTELCISICNLRVLYSCPLLCARC